MFDSRCDVNHAWFAFNYHQSPARENRAGLCVKKLCQITEETLCQNEITTKF